MIKEKNILTSYNFARNCTKVFVESVTPEQYELVKTNSSKIINRNQNMIIYKNVNLELVENDIIFCHSSFIKELFFHLKTINNLKNIKIVTSQSDLQIDKKLYAKKPKCVSQWFSINVNYDHEDLIPIPLGIANNYSPKNIRFNDLINHDEIKKNKINKIYCNFNPNTNDKERKSIFNLFRDNGDFIFDLPQLSIQEYIDKISKHKYILAPWGNGFDTHRVWEAFYLKSIPIIKRHKTYEFLENSSAIFVNEFEDFINIKIENLEDNLKHEDNEFLNIQFWIKKINSNVIESKEVNEINETERMTKFRIFEQKFIYNLQSYRKKIRYYLMKFPRAFAKYFQNN
tara:strand:+ start:8192 stop:9220 length:1029 start_codon:yes stop_codon:yes gene_type:complete